MGTENTTSPLWQVDPTTAWTLADDGTAVLMDMASGLPLRLSPSGSVIWYVLVEGRTPHDEIATPPLRPLTQHEVAAEVAAAFGETPETVAPGVADFLGMLAERGILIPLHPSPRSS